ncbi:MAG TPA: tyrosine-type recombinase/integrase [Pseudoxanthomonas sp.]|nr:tyrosine-type recombinase/integrase [Pseudoxanthomonas sp.]
MGRPRKHNKHLPENMILRHGAYYFIKGGKYLPLSKDYGPALVKYAEIIGMPAKVSTVKEAVWHYIEHKRGKLAKATIEGYIWSAANLEAVFGKMQLSDITQPMVYRYLSEAGTVQANRDKALLSAAFTHARNLGAFTGMDPTKKLQFRNTETPRERYVTDGEMAVLLNAASPKLRCIIRLSYLTGMRQGDVLRIKMADITDDGIRYWNTKSKRWQHVEWSDELLEVVTEAKRLWRRFGREYLFESVPKGKHASRGPGPYTTSGVRALFRTVRAKTGITDVRLHDIRGKAGSDVETQGDAQRLLGHADGKVTAKHYRRKPERTKPVR